MLKPVGINLTSISGSKRTNPFSIDNQPSNKRYKPLLNAFADVTSKSTKTIHPTDKGITTITTTTPKQIDYVNVNKNNKPVISIPQQQQINSNTTNNAFLESPNIINTSSKSNTNNNCSYCTAMYNSYNTTCTSNQHYNSKQMDCGCYYSNQTNINPCYRNINPCCCGKSGCNINVTNSTARNVNLYNGVSSGICALCPSHNSDKTSTEHQKADSPKKNAFSDYPSNNSYSTTFDESYQFSTDINPVERHFDNDNCSMYLENTDSITNWFDNTDNVFA